MESTNLELKPCDPSTNPYQAEVGTPADDVYQLIEALVHNVSLGAFVLARKLEALPEAVA
jgi:hypothetical protein